MQRHDEPIWPSTFSHSSTPHWTAATRALRGLPDDPDSVSPTFDLPSGLHVGFMIRHHPAAQSEHRIK
jgi:hypothetical protein